MPVRTVSLVPGVNAEVTAALGQAQIIDSQLIRFKMAGSQLLPEKLGGWAKFYPVPFGSPVRALHAWEGINADTWLAAGCEQSLDVIHAGLATDITPRTLRTNPTPDFSTTSGSNVVTVVDAGITPSVYDSIDLLTPIAVGGLVLQGSYPVRTVVSTTSYTIEAGSNAASTVANSGSVPVFTTTSGTPQINVLLTNHGLSVGNTFYAPVSTTVGGIAVLGAYIVQGVTDADNFTIVASIAAASSASGAMNGGDAAIQYYIAIGPQLADAGYGVGTYGEGAYGLGVSPTPSQGSPITTTNWTLDNWGEILLACPANAPIYSWSPDSGFTTAVKITTAPSVNGGIFVSNAAQILIAWASSINDVQDPLLVQWSDSGDYTQWQALTTTQAGNFRIPTGSKIAGGRAGPQFNLIWTDIDVWAMDYIGYPDVYGFNKLATNCGLIGRHAHCTSGASVYWMGNKQFYAMTSGSVTPIPCPVWDFIFQDLDTANLDKICCASNSGFSEVTWYFPSKSGGTGEIDSYVKVNTANGFVWDFGRLQRTAWIDQSVVGQPIGGTANGTIYQHEISPDADGQPLVSSFTTGDFQIADGDELQFVDWIIPDFRYGAYESPQHAALQVTLSFTNYPGAARSSVGPYSMTATTPYVNTRLRARFAAIFAQSSDLGSFWRLGALKLRAAPDGRL